MARFEIHRRAVLRGLGGAVLPLPALEAMVPNNARAAGVPPKRFVLCYGGISIGGYRSPWQELVPPTAGVNYEVTRGLKGVTGGADYSSVKADVGIVSGLKIPWGPRGNVPLAGRDESQFHYCTKGVQLSGMSCVDVSKPDGGGDIPRGPSADSLVAPFISGGRKTLVYRVQPSSYYKDGSIGDAGRLSYVKNLNGNAQGIEPVSSLRLAYQSLFGQFSTSMPTSAGPDLRLARRKSIVDLVKQNTQQLLLRLGQGDRARLQSHFDEVRDLEKRLDLLDSLTCTRPSDPPADPSIGGTYLSTSGGADFIPTSGWSNEELRAQVLCDYLRLALICDLNRVATLLFTMSQANVNMIPISNRNADMHGMGHASGPVVGSPGDMADAAAWHIKHFSRLAAKLKGSPAGDGSSVLDHTAMVLLFEGGHGRSPDSDATEEMYRAGTHFAHSSENMVAVVAGGAGGLKTGQHIRFNNDRHPAQVVLSMMKAVGVNGPLGEVSEPLPELFKLVT